MIDLFAVLLFFCLFGIIHLVTYLLYNIYVMCFVGMLKILNCGRKKDKIISIIELEIDVNNFCSICYENYLSDKVILRLNCDHIFHKKCLDRWWERINIKLCPYCRKENTNLLIVKNTNNINVN